MILKSTCQLLSPFFRHRIVMFYEILGLLKKYERYKKSYLYIVEQPFQELNDEISFLLLSVVISKHLLRIRIF